MGGKRGKNGQPGTESANSDVVKDLLETIRRMQGTIDKLTLEIQELRLGIGGGGSQTPPKPPGQQNIKLMPPRSPIPAPQTSAVSSKEDEVVMNTQTGWTEIKRKKSQKEAPKGTSAANTSTEEKSTKK